MMMTPTDDIRIDPEITTLSRALDRRAVMRAGAAAGATLLFGGASSLAAPLAPVGDPPEDPWETGACDNLNEEDELDDEQPANDLDDEESDDGEVILPSRILIPAIDVDARVEVLEIVNDTLQDPSNGDDVAWYKETARAGEEGNAVFAGHLNWYGMPEAVFFAIDRLVEGDEVLIRDGSCREHRYLVEWVELVEVATADMTEITGPSEQALLTLITCGGAWDPSISQYRERTVVRTRLEGAPRPAPVDDDQPAGDDDLGPAPTGDETDDESPRIVPRGG